MIRKYKEINHIKPTRLFPFTVGISILLVGVVTFSAVLTAKPLNSDEFTQPLSPEDISDETCTLSASEMTYRYNQLQANLFKLTEMTPLPPVTQIWQINCSRPVAGMSIFVSGGDIVSGDSSRFDLGPVNGDGSLGFYTVTLSEAQVDGNKVFLSQSTEAISEGNPQKTILLRDGYYQNWVMQNGLPISGQSFSIEMEVSPILNSLEATRGPLVDGGKFDSNLYLGFSFGI